MKEKITMMDGSIKEVEIHGLGYRKAIQLISEYVPIDSMSVNKADDTVTMSGKIKLFELQLACLETCKDLKEGTMLDDMDPEEANRLYETYFKRTIDLAMGQASKERKN